MRFAHSAALYVGTPVPPSPPRPPRRGSSGTTGVTGVGVGSTRDARGGARAATSSASAPATKGSADFDEAVNRLRGTDPLDPRPTGGWEELRRLAVETLTVDVPRERLRRGRALAACLRDALLCGDNLLSADWF